MANILQTIKRALTRDIYSGQNIQTQLIPLGALNEIYADVNASNVIERYQHNATVYSIVNKDALKFSSIPRYVYDMSDKEVPDTSPLAVLLKRPNSMEGADSFFAKVRIYRLVCGEAFIWLNRGIPDPSVDDLQWSRRPILEMQVLPSDQMIVLGSPSSLFDVAGYRLQLGATRVNFRRTDVIHWKNCNLQTDLSTRSYLRGFPPLEAGRKILQQNESSTDAQVRQAQTDGSKGFLVSTLGITPEQRTQIQMVTDRKLNSNSNAGSVQVLQGKDKDWAYIDLKSSISLQTLESKKQSYAELCHLYDIPPELFEGSETTFSNKELAQKNWVSNTIIPASRQFDDELNRALLPAFDVVGRQYIESDFADLPEMAEDIEKKIATMVAAGSFTINEFRTALSYDKLPDPLFDEVMIGSSVTPASDVAAQPKVQQLTNRLNQLQNGQQLQMPMNGISGMTVTKMVKLNDL